MEEDDTLAQLSENQLLELLYKMSDIPDQPLLPDLRCEFIDDDEELPLIESFIPIGKFHKVYLTSKGHDYIKLLDTWKKLRSNSNISEMYFNFNGSSKIQDKILCYFNPFDMAFVHYQMTKKDSTQKFDVDSLDCQNSLSIALDLFITEAKMDNKNINCLMFFDKKKFISMS